MRKNSLKIHVRTFTKIGKHKIKNLALKITNLALKITNLALNFGRNDKNREKKLQFFGVNESKIRWTVLEKKFTKRKNFNENQEPQNQIFGFKNLEKIIKIEKKICNFSV